MPYGTPSPEGIAIKLAFVSCYWGSGADFTSTDREALDFGLSRGCGAIWLSLKVSNTRSRPHRIELEPLF